MLEPGCRDLIPFSRKSISEIQHWCWVIRRCVNSTQSGKMSSWTLCMRGLMLKQDCQNCPRILQTIIHHSSPSLHCELWPWPSWGRVLGLVRPSGRPAAVRAVRHCLPAGSRTQCHWCHSWRKERTPGSVATLLVTTHTHTHTHKHKHKHAHRKN